MKKYDPKQIEPKWQTIWAETGLYKTEEKSGQKKAYVLDFFPYPSGAGLSVGHVRNYAISDVYSRFMRLRGYNVLHPMGWDAFGLPAENYALKNKVSPREATDQNKANYKRQMQMVGLSYDWDREIDSTDPNYYRWTQWFFLLLYKRGLAYQADSLQWWCEHDKTVLANEQVEAGKCWRCGHPVTKKQLKQWFFKITDYADRLISDLDGLDWPEGIKQQQRNWIGKSEGAEIDFEIGDHKLTVFTTRPDTLSGATFLVLAPEHPLVAKITSEKHKKDVDKYVKKTQTESELSRLETDRPKTGVDTGAKANNPLTGAKIPVWIADYVLLGYGTGAIMAVPAEDERDAAFAKAHKLPISPVGKGDWQQFAHAKVSYKLRDWLISRQRYWGAPIPIIHCPDDGAVPVPEEDLPVLLPEIKDYEPAGDGRSPLAKVDSFVNTRCPKCGGPAVRETDTMDGFACSSWYFLRFTSPNETEHAFNKEAVKYWLPVDTYIGGAEHAVMHLLYARFWTKVMFDAKLIEFNEPFLKLRNQGMILAADGHKMSKSKGNVITPDEVVESGLGADALRMYEMFIAPYNQEVPWSEQGLTGTYRFLSRVWTLAQEVMTGKKAVKNAKLETAMQTLTHKTIKKVTDDLEDFGFNTAVAALMEFTNELYKIKVDLKPGKTAAWTETLAALLTLLAPFAPHITEELWGQMGGKTSIHAEQWPRYQEDLVKSSLADIAVQVNGKLRAMITLPANAGGKELEKTAKQAAGKYLGNQKITKTVVVPGKIVNFVTD